MMRFQKGTFDQTPCEKPSLMCHNNVVMVSNMFHSVAVRPGIQGIHRIPWRSLNNIFSVLFDMSFSIPSFKIHCQLLLFYIRIFLSDFVYEYEASIEQWP